ncbi:MAG: 5-formyltetrahydrofolate cyclo-ligase [Euryarchaeota archaeon]|nr:5-formyltetrahydrofolate cyclo-ligase [Euryarchaeota archaeon]
MKQALRTEFLQKRKQFNSLEVQEKSKQIKDRLFSLNEFKTSQTILFYVSYDNEVHTHDMIKECLSKKKNVVVPCTDITKRQLLLSELNNWNDLTACTYDILEPKQECRHLVALNDVELILVPGVVFDLHGQRIGHGKGYYDNLLRNATRQLKIGLAFELQLVDDIPAKKHDIKVDKIVTEKRVISCAP